MKRSCFEALLSACGTAGLSWDFFPSTTYTARFTSLLIALGGTLVTALLLGIVSGESESIKIKQFEILLVLSHRVSCQTKTYTQ